MSNIFAKYGISAEKERKMWTAHRREQLRCWASLPFGKKIQMLEDMEEVARAFHGGKLPRTADEHEEQTSETLPSARLLSELSLYEQKPARSLIARSEKPTLRPRSSTSWKRARREKLTI